MNNTDAAQPEDVQKVVDLINDAKIAMVTTIDEDGKLVSRPLAVQKVEHDGDLWFFTDRSSSQAAHVTRNPGVNVSFSRRDAWVSVSGDAEIIEDHERARQWWNPMVEAWFPDGPDTPSLVFLRVDAASAQYWDSPGGTLATVIGFIKSKATGRRPDVGESKTVDLQGPQAPGPAGV